MALEIIDSLSLAGDPLKPNEDAFAHGDQAAVVMDGATGLGDMLMPGASDAAWIAQFGARRVLSHLKNGNNPRKALRNALADAEESFKGLRRRPPDAQWELPCASMVLAAEWDGQMEMLWFGDCGGLLRNGGPVEVIGETFAKRAAEAGRARTIAKMKNVSPAAGLARGEFIGQLRKARDFVNSGNYWLFSPDVMAAPHVSRTHMAVAADSHLLLASDGFLALASDYGAYDADGLMAAALDKGLAALGAELRAIEDTDPGGDKFARFKKSDDATALLFKIN
jgi:hypothetical protein